LKHKAIFIFISPPDEKELEKRLRGRMTESEDLLMLRLETAKKEMSWGLGKNNVDHVLCNDEVERAYERLKTILLEPDNYVE
jgi:guanylate kinase